LLIVDLGEEGSGRSGARVFSEKTGGQGVRWSVIGWRVGREDGASGRRSLRGGGLRVLAAGEVEEHGWSGGQRIRGSGSRRKRGFGL